MDINIKYYLNRKLKSKINDFGECFPVYFRFNLYGNNHRVKSRLIDYLPNEATLDNYKKEIERETQYVETLISKFGDFHLIYDSDGIFDIFNGNLYWLINFFYLNKSEGDLNFLRFRNKSGYNFNVRYREEYAKYLSEISGFSLNVVDFMTRDDIRNLRIKLPTNFITDERLLFDTILHNKLLEIIQNDNPIGFFDWYFKNGKNRAQELLTEQEFSVVEKTLNDLYKGIFE